MLYIFLTNKAKNFTNVETKKNLKKKITYENKNKTQAYIESPRDKKRQKKNNNNARYTTKMISPRFLP